ncbi:DUF3515 domain-containing protein [Streptacidiphilus sp. PB12-B1b]|uniref:DUF3515 family protein n=1 Tax=Streptacidiphilus sp. PB12-B1b TaxID=2705012 RepID=UPI0015F819A8|nr:DUF3515 family protein [Streptacidiphilus sp. PB12-B1b]QMU78945.1 DUF3515 domain-containing protein [Streptacidiphilus sp. PB12-B1b]
MTATTGAALALLAGCSGGLHVPAPVTTGAAAAQCRSLHALLPPTLMGQKRRSSSPASDNTAAWGDPAITVRCGVAEPGPLDPRAADYDPTELHTVWVLVDGVCWLTQPPADNGGGFTFTTVKQQTYVQVHVPGAYAGQSYPLPALAGPVLKADPANPDSAYDCA